MPKVEFEFCTWVLPKATADRHSGSGCPRFFLFVYVCKWVAGKKPLLEWQSVVAATVDCHCGGGHHCRSSFWQWPWTQAQVVNSNSTSTGKETLCNMSKGCDLNFRDSSDWPVTEKGIILNVLKILILIISRNGVHLQVIIQHESTSSWIQADNDHSNNDNSSNADAESHNEFLLKCPVMWITSHIHLV